MFPGIVVGRWSHPSGELLTGRRVLVPPLTRSRELVLQLHEADDLVDVLSRHAGHRHFVLRLIDGRLGGWYACAGDADQKGHVLRADGGERHDPSRLADAQAVRSAWRRCRCVSSSTRRRPRRRRPDRRTRRCSSPPSIRPHPVCRTRGPPCRGVSGTARREACIPRFCAPEPCTRMIAGCFPLVAGLISVPASRTSPLEKRTSSRLSISTRRASRRRSSFALPRERDDLAGSVALKLDP